MIECSASSMRDGVCSTISQVVSACPSTVAITRVDPRACVVARPLLLIVAIEAVVVLQVTTRPVSGFPALSRGVAVYCCESPSSTRAESGASVTDRTGTGTTVVVLVPFLLLETAVTVTVPVRRPVTLAVEMPVATTTATDVSLLVHVACLLMADPFAFVTVSVRLCPTRIVVAAGVTISPGADGAGAFATRASPVSSGADGFSPQPTARIAATRDIPLARAIRKNTRSVMYQELGDGERTETNRIPLRRFGATVSREGILSERLNATRVGNVARARCNGLCASRNHPLITQIRGCCLTSAWHLRQGCGLRSSGSR